jgi:UPF0755 protein
MKKIGLLLLFPIVILTALMAIVYLPGNKAFSSSEKTKSFTINQGDGLVSVAKRLKSADLIRSEANFVINSYLLGLNRRIQSGTFYLSPSMTPGEIITRLSQGGSHDYWLKFKEGWRLEEIAQNLPPESPVTAAEFLAASQGQEGYLFPDSYLIPYSYTPNQVVSLLRSHFQEKLASASQDKTNFSLGDDHDYVILASILEREGRSLESKKMIAGILMNRLTHNSAPMPLQVDATVQYARDSKASRSNPTPPFTFWQPLLKDDLSIKSAYNTYQTNGLPPAPICNPGYDSLFAAYHPSDSQYFFYITGNDGKMYYAQTADEHNANVAKYLR